jgi:hypothetical protein
LSEKFIGEFEPQFSRSIKIDCTSTDASRRAITHNVSVAPNPAIRTMKLLNVLVGGCFALAVKAAVPPRNTTEVKSAQIRQLLTSQLSKNASIIFPTSKRWDEVTHRAAAPRVNPGYLAVVDVAVEDDVVRTACAPLKQS